MRKPKHALADATTLTVSAFEVGKRNIVTDATGSDPSKVAKSIVDALTLTDADKRSLRGAIRKACVGVTESTIPGLTDVQFEHKGRRLRIHAAA